MKLYNSLTKEKQTFEPIHDDQVGVYTCGPTVYSHVTIGNWRTYVLGDVLMRSLQFLGYEVNYVMNITDVGHLTGDNLGDADTGEDRLEKAAKSEGKTAWDIADFYAQDFVHGFSDLNLQWPTKPQTDSADQTTHFAKATSHIDEQINLVQEILDKGMAYQIKDGVYFDVLAFEAAGHRYGQLSNIDQVKEGARVEPNPHKKDPRDFALWKFSTSEEKRHMEWDSPWGKGFPGWHIECSAMSMKYLGEQFDIHLGGEDLKSTHHPNEIAQAEAVTGKQFVRYWMHGAFLQVDGGRMGKSLGNAYTLADIKERGIDPMALRYFYYSAHYRKPLNFTWEGLESAADRLHKIKQHALKLKEQAIKSNELSESQQTWDKHFRETLADDLNMPQALAVLSELLHTSKIEDPHKWQLLESWDRVLGLALDTVETIEIPQEISELTAQREQARGEKDFAKADALRDQILQQGYVLEDSAEGVVIKKK